MSDEYGKIEEDADHGPEAVKPTAADGPPQKQSPLSVIVLGLVIAVLLALLLTMNRSKPDPADPGEDPALADVRAELDARRSELNRERMAMGLSPIQGASEPLDEIADRLRKDSNTLVSLASRFQEMLAEKDAEVAAKNSEIIRSEKLRQSVAAEAGRLNVELQRALAEASDIELLRRELALRRDTQTRLEEDLAKTRQELSTLAAGGSMEDRQVLQRQLDEALRAKDFFEKRVNVLEDELSKLRLFANSEDQLMPAAVELFRSLRRLEDTPSDDLGSIYAGMSEQLGATVLRTLRFESESSALSGEDEAVVRGLVEEVPDGDLVLIVGYASETGDVQQNERLSSARATAAAQSFAAVKRADQKIQAVYLGQTDRFSSESPERNQLCEVWHIRR